MNALEWIFLFSAGRGGIISNRSAPVVYLICSSVHIFNQLVEYT